MEYHYEVIDKKTKMPIKIFTHTVEQFPYHWHEEMEILFILRGSLEIRVDKKVTTLDEGDIFLVNQNDIHFISSNAEYGKTQLLALQFSLSYFERYDMDLSSRRFFLDTSETNTAKSDNYPKIRHLLAQMMDTAINQESHVRIKMETYLLDLMMILLNHFDVTDSSKVERDFKDDERLLNILKFINSHYNDRNLGLTMVADEIYLNPQYLSRYFSNRVGVSIKKYIDHTRMSKSLSALKLNKQNVLEIALGHGFPDAKAYYRVFKEVMGMTPVEYRQHHKIETTSVHVKDYFSINSREALSKLFEYLKPVAEIHRYESSEVLTTSVDVNSSIGILSNSINKLITFGYAPHGLRVDFQNQLKEIQRDIRFEYIRFHGIFSDDMHIYNERPDGSIFYNYNHLDALVDILLSNNLKPFFELGYMPAQLSSDDKTIFTWKGNVTPPKDMKKWTDMLEAFIRHLINRYGINAVREWRFEFWNEPEMNGFFWSGTSEEFFELYKESYRCIKAIDGDIKVGGFGNIFYKLTEKWIKNLSTYMRKNKIGLDFYSFHIYNMDINEVDDEQGLFDAITDNTGLEQVVIHGGAEYGVKLGDEKFFTEMVDKMIGLADYLPKNPKSYWITEWNAITDSRNLIHDTCFMAAFIIKNVLSNAHKLDGMGFWTFSDIFEEWQFDQPLFHGGFGLMTLNGLKKPGYWAYKFLGKLGSDIIYQDEKSIITSKNDEIQILIYNYCHFNRLYSDMDLSQISMHNRYDVFEKGTAFQHKIRLNGVNGKYMVEKQRLNRENGSVFDAWIKIGAPEAITDNALEFLKSSSLPVLETWIINDTTNICIETLLEPHEVQLITLKSIY